jgi:hypothetical protein
LIHMLMVSSFFRQGITTETSMSLIFLPSNKVTDWHCFTLAKRKKRSISYFVMAVLPQWECRIGNRCAQEKLR